MTVPTIRFNLNRIHDSVGKVLLRTANQGRVTVNTHQLSLSHSCLIRLVQCLLVSPCSGKPFGVLTAMQVAVVITLLILSDMLQGCFHNFDTVMI
jgi:hypothetical protein